MPAVARLAVAARLVTGLLTALALSLAVGLVAAGCGSDVDLGGFPPRDAAPDAADASTE